MPRAPLTSKRGLQVEWQNLQAMENLALVAHVITLQKVAVTLQEGNVKVTAGVLTLNSLNLGQSRVYSLIEQYFTVFYNEQKKKRKKCCKRWEAFQIYVLDLLSFFFLNIFEK